MTAAQFHEAVDASQLGDDAIERRRRPRRGRRVDADRPSPPAALRLHGATVSAARGLVEVHDRDVRPDTRRGHRDALADPLRAARHDDDPVLEAERDLEV